MDKAYKVERWRIDGESRYSYTIKGPTSIGNSVTSTDSESWANELCDRLNTAFASGQASPIPATGEAGEVVAELPMLLHALPFADNDAGLKETGEWMRKAGKVIEAMARREGVLREEIEGLKVLLKRGSNEAYLIINSGAYSEDCRATLRSLDSPPTP